MCAGGEGASDQDSDLTEVLLALKELRTKRAP